MDSDDDFDHESNKEALAQAVAAARAQQDEALRRMVKAEEDRIAKAKAKAAGKTQLKVYTKELMKRIHLHMLEGKELGEGEKDKMFLPEDVTELRQKSFYQLKLEEFEAAGITLESAVEAKAEIERLSKALEQTEAELEEIKTKLEEMSKKKEELANQVTSLEGTVTKHTEEHTVVKLKHVETATKAQALEESNKELRIQNEQLMKEAAKASQLRQEADLHSSKATQSTSQVQDLQSEVTQLKAELHEAQEVARQAKRDQAAAEDDAAHALSQAERYAERQREVTEDHAQMKAVASEGDAAAVQEVREQLERKVREVDEEAYRHKQRVTMLEMQAEERERKVRAAEAHQADLLAENRRLQEDKAKLEDLRRNAPGGWEDGEGALNNTLTTSKLGAECLKIAQIQLDQAHTELNQHMDDMMAKDAELDRVQKALEAEHADKEQLRLRLEEKRIECDWAERDRTRLQETTEEQLAEKDRRIRQLEEQLAALESRREIMSETQEALHSKSYVINLEGWSAPEYQAPMVEEPGTKVFPVNVLVTDDARRLGVGRHHAWLAINSQTVTVLKRDTFETLVQWALPEVAKCDDEKGQVCRLWVLRHAGPRAGMFAFKTPFSAKIFDHIGSLAPPALAPAPAPSLMVGSPRAPAYGYQQQQQPHGYQQQAGYQQQQQQQPHGYQQQAEYFQNDLYSPYGYAN